MKGKTMRSTKTLAILVLIICTANISNAAPMGTAFTYQGRLIDANDPADGLYDFEFKLFDDPCTGTQHGRTINFNDLDVIDGYFTLELDFGDNLFDGNDLWLETEVRPGDTNDANDFVTLNPRQELTPIPYAIYTRKADYAETAGSDSDWIVSGSNMYSIPSGRVGIGTSNPNEKLTVRGAVSLMNIIGEMPSSTFGYGKLYVRHSNGKLYFKDWSGIEYDLTKHFSDFYAGNDLVIANDTERSTSYSSPYILLKEIRIHRGGALRIKYDIRSSTAGVTVYAIIRRNYGSASGFILTSSTSSTTYSTVTQDTYGWEPGDLVQVWGYTSNSEVPINVRNFRLYAGNVGEASVNIDY
jgi:hypothetical protein